MNRPLLTNNTSGFKGVSWCKKTKRWQVKIRAQNQRYHIGLFDTAEEASAAYIAAALKLHGEFVNIGCEARTREEA
jgi:hypothetical protein